MSTQFFSIQATELKKAFQEIKKHKTGGNFGKYDLSDLYLSLVAKGGELEINTFSGVTKQISSRSKETVHDIIRVKNIKTNNFDDNFSAVVNYSFIKYLVEISHVDSSYEFYMDTPEVVNIYGYNVKHSIPNLLFTNYDLELNMKTKEFRGTIKEIFEISGGLVSSSTPKEKEKPFEYEFTEIEELKNIPFNKIKTCILKELVKDIIPNKYLERSTRQELIRELVLINEARIEDKTGERIKLKEFINENIKLYGGKFEKQAKQIVDKYNIFADKNGLSGFVLQRDYPQIRQELEELENQLATTAPSRGLVSSTNQIVLRQEYSFVLTTPTNTHPPVQKPLKPFKICKMDNLKMGGGKTVIEFDKKEISEPNIPTPKPQMYFVFENIIVFQNMVITTPKTKTNSVFLDNYHLYLNTFVLLYLGFNFNTFIHYLLPFL